MSDKVNWSDMYPNIEEPSWVKDVELLTAQEALALHKLGIEVSVWCIDNTDDESAYLETFSLFEELFERPDLFFYSLRPA